MAKILDIITQPRTSEGTAAVNRLRKAGSIPAVVYGRKTAPLNVQVNTKVFTKLLESSASDNILVSLKIESGEQLALVQEVQHDHLRGGILHVDFHAVAMDEEIHAEVPLTMVGESPGAKAGGLIEAIHHTLEVRCLPKDLPEALEVDISDLQTGKGIHVGDLKLPEGVRAKLADEVVLIMCEEPKVVEEVPAAAAPAAKGAKGAAAAKPAAKK
ncbi:large subunit ribosomal protein L25 [Prosthecobacter fusiformis]|uniref:Large ribosomal subunit protein bL25 n=1 Tax=Prosthecobacter fusiformis TaxID=48464 RepID=A0A4R7RP45_9BACT|nr:50S ribosomal protein L25 [Prosthecobacter fusiformis]TDU66588.1 large subunit ribosomal protein L25 [Prosthecobacter fusiformis]